MKPAFTRKDRIPIEVARTGLREGAVRAIVDHFSGSLTGPLFEEVEPDPIAAAHDEGSADAVPTQFIDRAIAEIVSRQPRDEFGVSTKPRDEHRDIRLRPSGRHFEVRRLRKSLMPGRGQPEHDFAKGDNGGHSRRRMGERLAVCKARSMGARLRGEPVCSGSYESRDRLMLCRIYRLFRAPNDIVMNAANTSNVADGSGTMRTSMM